MRRMRTDVMQGRGRIAGRVAAVLLVALALAWPSAAAAAQDGIAGTVLNGSRKDAPVGGQRVELRTLDATGTELPAATAETGADGTFSFDVPDGAASYRVTATFDGTSFASPMLPIRAGQPATVTLKVYETTTDASAVRQTGWVVWVDREGGGFAVQQDVQWKNDGKEAYVGSGGADAVTIQVPVAPGATGLQFLGLFLDTPGAIRGESFVDTAPIPPGTSTATLRYSVASLDELTFPILFDTDSFQLFVPSDIEVGSTGLTTAGQTTDQGVTYQILAATDLKGGDRLQVGLTPSSSRGVSPIALVLGGSLLVALLGGIAMWRLTRARDRRPARARGRSAPEPAPRRDRTTARARLARAAQGRANGNGRPHADGLEDEADDEDLELLIDEIAALDLSFERGLLEETSYRRLRAAAKRRLVRARGARTGGSSR